MANFYKDPFEDRGDYFRRQAFTMESVPPMEEQLAALEQVQPNSVDPYASEFRKGFRQGVLGLEKDAYGAAKQASSLVGLDSAARYFEDQMKPLAREMQTYAAPRVQRVEDVQSVGDLADYAMGMLGQTAPSMGVALAGGAVGSLAGRALGGLAGARVGGFTGALESSAIPQVGDIGERLDAAGKPNPLLAIAAGHAAGVLDVLPLMHGVERVGNIAKGKANPLLDFAKQTGEEAWTEGAQEVIARGAENIQTGAPMFNDEALSAYLNNALGGAIAGGAFGGGIAAAGGVHNYLKERMQQYPLPQYVSRDDTNPYYSTRAPGVQSDVAAWDRPVGRQPFPYYDEPKKQFIDPQSLAQRSMVDPLPSGRFENGVFKPGREQQVAPDAPQDGEFWPQGSLDQTYNYDLTSPAYDVWRADATNALETGSQAGSQWIFSPTRAFVNELGTNRRVRKGEQLPYISDATAALEKYQKDDPTHDYRVASMYDYVTSEIEKERLAGMAVVPQEAIRQAANRLYKNLQGSTSAPNPKDFSSASEYLKAFPVILKTPQSFTKIDDEGGIGLTPYELSKPDAKGYSVMHGDANKFAKQRGAMRGFEASTAIRDENRPEDGGNRYFDAPTLTMLMKDKLKGRLPTENRLVNRVATYFSTGLASMMTNPTIGLDPKSLKLDDNTIVYNGANGEQVRWGQIKQLTDPVKGQEMLLTALTEDRQRTEDTIQLLSSKKGVLNKYEAASLDWARNRLTNIDEQTQNAVRMYQDALESRPATKAVELQSGKVLNVERMTHDTFSKLTPDEAGMAIGAVRERVARLQTEKWFELDKKIPNKKALKRIDRQLKRDQSLLARLRDSIDWGTEQGEGIEAMEMPRDEELQDAPEQEKEPYQVTPETKNVAQRIAAKMHQLLEKIGDQPVNKTLEKAGFVNDAIIAKQPISALEAIALLSDVANGRKTIGVNIDAQNEWFKQYGWPKEAQNALAKEGQTAEQKARKTAQQAKEPMGVAPKGEKAADIAARTERSGAQPSADGKYKYAQGDGETLTPVTVGKIKSELKRLVGRHMNNIKVVKTVEELPGEGHPPGTMGMYDPETKTAYLVADNVYEHELTGLILHELGVHYGMERMLGPKLFRQVIDEVMKKAEAGEEAFAAALAKAKKGAGDPSHVAEETLAYLIQNSPELGIVRKIIATIRQWIYRITDGALIDLSEADLRQMAASALRYMAKPPSKQGKPWYLSGSQEAVRTIEQALRGLPKALRDAATIIYDNNPNPEKEAALSLAAKMQSLGVTDPMAILWWGKNNRRLAELKQAKTEAAIRELAEKQFNKRTDPQNFKELFREDDDTEQDFRDWMDELGKYDVFFKDVMLDFVLENVTGKSIEDAFIEPVSSIGLRAAYEYASDHPYDQGIGKWYRNYVMQMVMESVESTPALTTQGRWVKIPQTRAPYDPVPLSSIGGRYMILPESQDLTEHTINEAKALLPRDFLGDMWVGSLYVYNGRKYTLANTSVEENGWIKQRVLSAVAEPELLEYDIAKNLQLYNRRFEAFKRLSCSTWCTSSTHTASYMGSYDNYLLVVPKGKTDQTVVGIEINPTTGRANDVSSANNNGVASIDYLDETLAFLKTIPGLNQDPEDIGAVASAIRAKTRGETDATQKGRDGGFDDFGWGIPEPVFDRGIILEDINRSRFEIAHIFELTAAEINAYKALFKDEAIVQALRAYGDDRLNPQELWREIEKFYKRASGDDVYTFAGTNLIPDILGFVGYDIDKLLSYLDQAYQDAHDAIITIEEGKLANLNIARQDLEERNPFDTEPEEWLSLRDRFNELSREVMQGHRAWEIAKLESVGLADPEVRNTRAKLLLPGFSMPFMRGDLRDSLVLYKTTRPYGQRVQPNSDLSYQQYLRRSVDPFSITFGPDDKAVVTITTEREAWRFYHIWKRYQIDREVWDKLFISFEMDSANVWNPDGYESLYDFMESHAQQADLRADQDNDVNEFDDIPFSRQATGNIEGWATATQVVLNAAHLRPQDAAKVLLHEVAHRGMLRMAKDLGGFDELYKALQAASTELYKAAPDLLSRTGHKSLAELINDYGFDISSPEGEFKLLSELAARWAEKFADKPAPSWWKKFIGAVKNWLAKFTKVQLTEAEVNNLISGFVAKGAEPQQKYAVRDSEHATNVANAQKIYEEHKSTYDKMQRLADDLSKKLGLKHKVLIASPDQLSEILAIYGDVEGSHSSKYFVPGTLHQGTVWTQVVEVPKIGSRRVIWINPQMVARNKYFAIETLAHELGHVVYHDHWGKAPVKTVMAVIDAFESWKDKGLRSGEAKEYIRARKKGLINAASFGDLVQKHGLDNLTPLGKLSKSELEYLFDFQEWFADQVSRWIETDARPLSAVEKFFSDIAKAFRDLWEVLRGTDEHFADTSIREFMDDVLKRTGENRSYQSFIGEVFKQRGERAALEYVEYMETGKWPGKPHAPVMYAQRQYPDLRTPSPTGSTEAFEKSVIAKAIRKLQRYNKILAKINAADGLTFLRSLRAILGRDLPHLPKWWANDMAMVFEALLPNAQERNVLYRAAQSRPILQQMFKALHADKETMDHIQESPAVAAAYMYMLHKAGLIKVGPSTFQTFGVFTHAIDKLYRYFVGRKSDNEKILALLEGLEQERVAQRFFGGYWEMPRDLRRNFWQKASQDISDKLAELHRKYTARLISPAFEHAMSTNNPYIQWVARKMFAATDDLNPNKSLREAIMQVGAYLRKRLAFEDDNHTPGGVFGEKFKDEEYLRRVLEAMQNSDVLNDESAEVKASAAKLRKWFKSIYKYTQHAGLKYGERENYFPWYFDPDAVQANLPRWERFVRQPHFLPYWEKMAEARNKEEEARAVASPQYTPHNWTADEVMEDVTQRLLGGDINNIDSSRDIHNPQFRFMNTRDIWFLGSDDVANSNDRAFLASLMQKNMHTVLFTYVRQAIRRAEFAKRFGANGEKLWAALEKASETGASDDDVELMKGFVDAMLGTSGMDTKKTLDRWIEKLPLPDEWKAKMTTGTVINQKLQNAMGWMMVYQNYRLLALATLSSVIDPLGIGVRGSDFSLALLGMREAIRETFKTMKGGQSDLIQLADMLGITERTVILDALVDQYGNNYLGAKQTRVNDMLFKYNGLEAWTKLTRIAGTASALAFIRRHVQQPTKNSERFLMELGIHKNDVIWHQDGSVKVLSVAERRTANDEEKARDDRVRNAIFRFVEGSILRPDAAQRPLIFSDPHFMLFGHLKSYMFSFYERILKRAYSEAVVHTNLIPMISLLAFIPVMFIGDAIRELIQYGPNGAPWKRGWSVADHIQYEAVRAGLIGRGEIMAHADMSGITSLLGPTTEQMADLVSSNPSLGTDLVNALPLQNIYKHWWDRAPDKTQTQLKVEGIDTRVKNIEAQLAMI